MTHPFYELAWAAATPFVIARLAWRSRRQPGYLEHLGERFGRYATAAAGARIWIHAVSVGETRAALPLARAFEKRYPTHRILITHMTPTGRETGASLFGEGVEQAWLPYDLTGATRAFFAHFKPAFGVIMETEIWPRTLEEAARAGVPVVLANARLSEKSAKRYARAPWLTRWALSNLAGIAAQTESDRARFAAIGANAPVALGNVKFDLTVPPEMLERGRELRGRFGGHRPVLVAGSTREGEEALLLDALGRAPGDALLVIVPRHPQRFDEVASLAAGRGFKVARRSDAAAVSGDVRVMIGDSMGEMLAYYAAADVAILGGSLLPYGGQNLIEPAAVGCPVIAGPHTFNFEEAARDAIGAGAALRVDSAARALEVAAELVRDEARRKSMGQKARAFVEAHRGAAERIAAWIEKTVAHL